MTGAEKLIARYDLIDRVVALQLRGVTHEESLINPPFRGNCLNWVLGHLVFSRTGVLRFLQESVPWTKEEAQPYTSESDPLTADKALPLEQILEFLEISQTRLRAGLSKVSAEELDAPAGEGTREDRISFAQWHETYHLGQLELLRQLTGKDDQVL